MNLDRNEIHGLTLALSNTNSVAWRSWWMG